MEVHHTLCDGPSISLALSRLPGVPAPSSYKNRLSFVSCRWPGAACAWGTMSWYPNLAKKLAILNVPHPTRFAEGLSTPEQVLKSWYIFAFQLPLLAEISFAALDGQLIRRVFSSDADEPLDTWELDRYVAASSGGMSGGINWYRAAGAGLWPANMPSVPGGLIKMIQIAQGVKGMPKTSTSSVRSQIIEVPVMVLWGTRGLSHASP